MGYITLAILGITAFYVFFGALFGLIRGRNRSLLKLGLILASAATVFFLKDTLVNFVLNLNIKGTTINTYLTDFLTNEANLPNSLQTIAVTLVEIIAGIIIFLISFFLLNLIISIIIFPILKLFVRRGVNKHALQGMAIGLVQGLVIAFIICVPVTGLLTQANKITEIQYQDAYLIEVPAEIGLSEYVESTPAKVYMSTGGWFFNALSSKEDENGNIISINDTCDIVTTVVTVADEFSGLTDTIDNLSKSDLTDQEKIDSIKTLGDSLISIGNSVDTLSDDAKTVVQEVIDGTKELFKDESGNIDENVEKMLDNLDINDLKLESAGKAMNGMASYIEKTSSETENTEPVTQEEINNIINGLEDNSFIIDMVGNNGTMMDVNDSDKEMFATAIGNSELSNEYKAMLEQMFGIN